MPTSKRRKEDDGYARTNESDGINQRLSLYHGLANPNTHKPLDPLPQYLYPNLYTEMCRDQAANIVRNSPCFYHPFPPGPRTRRDGNIYAQKGHPMYPFYPAEDLVGFNGVLTHPQSIREARPILVPSSNLSECTEEEKLGISDDSAAKRSPLCLGSQNHTNWHAKESSNSNLAANNKIVRAHMRAWQDKKGHMLVRRNIVALM
eukprot:6221562-Ditylum_brightwellii.AAC.1